MPTTAKRNQGLEWAYWVGWLALLASLVFSWRAVTSGALMLLLLIAIGERISGRRGNTGAKYLLIPAIIYSAIQLGLAFYHNDLNAPALQVKAGVLAFPLLLYLSGFIDRKTAPWLFHAFALMLAIAFLYCLTLAFFNTDMNTEGFFYHQLVSPVRGHAVYLSIYVFVALIYLMEAARRRDWLLPKLPHAILAILLVIFLVMLASKLVIAFFLLYLVYFIYALFRNHRKRKQFAVVLLLLAIVNAALLFSTDNPVKERFVDLEGKIDVGEQNDPGQYLNGLQFRVLQWKIIPQILSEKGGWLTGVGLGNAQEELNSKYRERNLYQGNGAGDHGYLAYNAHNQFLQELLQGGVLALAGFVLMCVGLVLLALRSRSAIVIVTVGLVLVYCLVESVLETQYGVVIFSLLTILLAHRGPQRSTEGHREPVANHQSPVRT